MHKGQSRNNQGKLLLIIYAESNKINHESEDWTDFIDRGGLIHIYMLLLFFHYLEMAMRH